MPTVILAILLALAAALPARAEYRLPPSRILDWSSTGVPGGIPTIPDADLRTYAGGSIQACIETKGKKGCYLPAGTYELSGVLNIPDEKVLRGAGIGRTILRQTGNSDTIAMNGNRTPPMDRGAAIPIQRGHTKGSTDLEFASLDPAVRSGTIIAVSETNPADWIFCDFSSRAYNFGQGGAHARRDQGQIVEVSGRKGNTISLAEPLIWTATSSPVMFVFDSPLKRNAGLENLEIVYASKPATLRNVVTMQSAYGCWIRNVKIGGTTQSAIKMSWGYRNTITGVWLDDAFLHGNGGQGYGVFLDGPNTRNRVENSVFYKLRHSVVMQGACSGNVIAYNYSRASHPDRPDARYILNDIITHAGHATYNLYEGNWAQKLTYDRVHGSSGYNTMFRNYSRVIGESIVDTWTHDNGELCDSGKVKCSYDHPYNQPVAVNIDANNRYASLVGNIFGYPGLVEWMTGKGLSLAYEGGNNAVYRLGYTGPGGGKFDDPAVKATLLRHQNYDFKSRQQLDCNAKRSDVSTDCQDGGADPVLPKSLYLAAQPDYWCAELSFPPIDASRGRAGEIPAKRRFDSVPCTAPNGKAF
jgi:hypothetical protein